MGTITHARRLPSSASTRRHVTRWRAKVRGSVALTGALGMLLPVTGLLMAEPAAAGTGGTSTTVPFNECPAIGSDTSCGLLFVIKPDGSVSVLTDAGQPAYDTPSSEDTLVGVVNQSPFRVTSLTLTSTSTPGAFEFDIDGICSGGSNPTPNAPGCPYPTTSNSTYAGPDNTFTVADGNHGTVNFTGAGLAPGASTYFGLEGAVTAQSLEFPLAAQSVPVSAVEGQTFSGPVATFTDSDATDPTDAAANDTATINWGDGTTSPGTVSADGGGRYTVSGSHTYADEGSPTVIVTVADPDDPAGSPTSGTASVTDAALTNAAGAPVSGTEGNPVGTSTVATFIDTNPAATAADFNSAGGSTTIDWGDGTSSAGTVTQTGPGQFAVSGDHRYADEGSYPIAVRILDSGGSTAAAHATATIADASLAATGSPDFVSTNPVSHTLATFTDANPGATTADFTTGGGSTTIDWGDASTSAGTVTGPAGGPFNVSGTHTYAALGPYTITVKMLDDGGATATATTHVIVYATSVGGNFVLGDQTVAAAGPSSHVEFWGAQWAKDNSLSGGSVPDAFKGFENDPTSVTCTTGTWSTGPGNSAGPPATIPTYMAVIVSSAISETGPTINGNVVHMVVVKTDPGYRPNPGHAGTGTVVATIC